MMAPTHFSGHDDVWYSDDGGATYTVSKTNLTHMDEAQLVELPDGTIMANMRNNQCKCQGVALSKDGGASFSDVDYDHTLISPVCDAAIIRGRNGGIYFANPASTVGRENGVVRMSTDGVHWEKNMSVYTGLYGYSCLTNTADQDVMGLLWESGGPQCTGSGASCRTLYTPFAASLSDEL